MSRWARTHACTSPACGFPLNACKDAASECESKREKHGHGEECEGEKEIDDVPAPSLLDCCDAALSQQELWSPLQLQATRQADSQHMTDT